eukprot:scaffold308884_cov34-Prasinocladus_malaysianus.AAC.1
MRRAPWAIASCSRTASGGPTASPRSRRAWATPRSRSCRVATRPLTMTRRRGRAMREALIEMSPIYSGSSNAEGNIDGNDYL